MVEKHAEGYGVEPEVGGVAVVEVGWVELCDGKQTPTTSLEFMLLLTRSTCNLALA